MILRTQHLAALKRQLSNFPVVAILGARQVGKTTLARQLQEGWEGPVRRFDLEFSRCCGCWPTARARRLAS